MEEVSACIKLHLIQLTHESEVDHCTHFFACNHMKIATGRVDGLKLTK